jgi:hypothetical protein
MQYGVQEPDWDRLTAMINELAAKKGLVRQRTPSIVEAEEGHAPQRLKDVSYRRLGQALKKSPTIMYGIVDRYHKPSVETLAALADFASQEPQIPHLGDRGTWLKAGGFIREASEAGPIKLDDTERKIIALISDMTPEEKHRMLQLIEAGKRLTQPPRRGNPRKERGE